MTTGPRLRDVSQPRPANRPSGAGALALTPRERDVLEMIGHALTNREIAGRLCLSEKTVKHHVTVIMRKLGVRNRVEAALFAARLAHPRALAPFRAR